MTSLTFKSPTDTITFTEDDLPDTLPLGGELTGAAQMLSDGSKIFVATGESPVDIVLSGILRSKGSDGLTPVAKMLRIDAMRQRRQQVVVSSPSGAIGACLITKSPFSIIKNMQVQYSITLFREVVGALSGSQLGSLVPGSSTTPAAQAGSASLQHAQNVAGASTTLTTALTAAQQWQMRYQQLRAAQSSN